MNISAEAVDIIKQVTLNAYNEEWVRAFLIKATPNAVAEAMIVFAKMNKANPGNVGYRG